MTEIKVRRESLAEPKSRIDTIIDLVMTPLVWVFKGIMNGVGVLFDLIQNVVGINRMGYLFVLPNLLIFGIFVLFPMILNFRYAFTGGTRIALDERTFVGLDNFVTLFNCGDFLNPNTCQEDLFWRSVFNTFGFVVFQVTGMILFSLVTALVLNRKIPFRAFFRSVFFYPVLLSPVVVGLIWKWILQRRGILNALTGYLGIEAINFMTEITWARFWVIFISIWAQMGFYTLILLAGLQSIPGELYEAGEIDGANQWNSFRFITIPLLMPTMFVVLVLALIRAVQVFDQVFVLTGGGPGTATHYMVQYIYSTAFATETRLYGLAAAASVLLGIVLFVFTMIQLYLGRRSDAA